MSNVVDFARRRRKKLNLERASKETINGVTLDAGLVSKLGCLVPVEYSLILDIIIIITKGTVVDKDSIQICNGVGFERIGERGVVFCGLSQILVYYKTADYGTISLLFHILNPRLNTVTAYDGEAFKIVHDSYIRKCAEYNARLSVVHEGEQERD